MGSWCCLAALLLTVVAESGASRPPGISAAPAWARDAVWYQIFPGRFRNGDPTNDPTAGDVAQAWPHVKPRAWQRSPWTSDWYALQPWERADSSGFYVHAQQRRYGGDLQGVIEGLPYLRRLGITLLCLAVAGTALAAPRKATQTRKKRESSSVQGKGAKRM